MSVVLLHSAQRKPELADAQPVFVVGCVRSGTSAMVKALREGAGLPGFAEGNVAPLIGRLREVMAEYYRNFTPDYLKQPKNHMIAALDRLGLEWAMISLVAQKMLEQMGAGMWVDKSPQGAMMIHSCPSLLALFPQARFIFCKRRGIENILSRQRKFPGESFEHHCRGWAATMQAWRDVRLALGERAIEVDQREMALFPREVADALAQLLGLPQETQRAMEHALKGRRLEQTRFAQEDQVVDLRDTGWSEAQREQFSTLCGPMMQAFGYEEEVQQGVPGPIELFCPAGYQGVEVRQVRSEPPGFTQINPQMFQLHPNTPGSPMASVCFPATQLCGHTRFRSELLLGHASSQPVVFHFRVTDSAGEEVVAAQHEIVPGEPVLWEVEFAALRGPHHVWIGTEMAQGATNEAFAWARWANSRIE